MAIGDRIPTEIALTAMAATATTIFTNAADKRTQVTQLLIANTGATQRTLTFYKNGTAAANTILIGVIVPPTSSIVLDLKLIFTGTQTFSAKQDTGTDVTLGVYGVIEQIA